MVKTDSTFILFSGATDNISSISLILSAVGLSEWTRMSSASFISDFHDAPSASISSCAYLLCSNRLPWSISRLMRNWRSSCSSDSLSNCSMRYRLQIGKGRIRTFVDFRRRIYSPLQLTALPPAHRYMECYSVIWNPVGSGCINDPQNIVMTPSIITTKPTIMYPCIVPPRWRSAHSRLPSIFASDAAETMIATPRPARSSPPMIRMNPWNAK